MKYWFVSFLQCTSSQSHFIARKLKAGAVTTTVSQSLSQLPIIWDNTASSPADSPSTADPRPLTHVQAEAEEEQLHKNYFLTSS